MKGSIIVILHQYIQGEQAHACSATVLLRYIRVLWARISAQTVSPIEPCSEGGNEMSCNNILTCND